MSENETITITRERYEGLTSDAKLLSCLRGAGVDNWEGFEIALENMEQAND